MKIIIKLAILLSLLLYFTGCQWDPSLPAENIKGVNFGITISGILERSAFPTARVVAGTGGCTLTVLNQTTGSNTIYNWYVSMNPTTFEIISNRTLILSPGIYDFTLDIRVGQYQYLGTALSVQITDGENNVPITVVPVIGNIITTFNIHEIACMRFRYPAAELQSLDNPIISCRIDEDEYIITFDPETGISEICTDLEPGNYHLELKLYDGNVQVGRSIKEQENIIVQIKTDITMNLVPLHGDMNFSIAQNGGEAIFQFSIPEEVINETEGLENLSLQFRLYSAFNGIIEQEALLSVTDAGYQGIIELESFHYDSVTFAVTFLDKRNQEVLGACGVDNYSINSNEQFLSLNLDLIRRSFISGNLMGVVGITVLDENEIPQAGCSVYIDGEYYGLTGSALLGTSGYIKFYHRPGDIDITVRKDGLEGNLVMHIDTLGIYNEEIIIGN